MQNAGIIKRTGHLACIFNFLGQISQNIFLKIKVEWLALSAPPISTDLRLKSIRHRVEYILYLCPPPPPPPAPHGLRLKYIKQRVDSEHMLF